jgi:VIT family
MTSISRVLRGLRTFRRKIFGQSELVSELAEAAPDSIEAHCSAVPQKPTPQNPVFNNWSRRSVGLCVRAWMPSASLLSVGVTLLALFVFGYVKGRNTGTAPMRGAVRTVIIGALAAGAAYLIAKWIA